MIILHNYGAKANLVLQCDQQDSKDKKQEIEIIIDGIIYNQRKYLRIYLTMMSIVYKVGEYSCGNSLY